MRQTEPVQPIIGLICTRLTRHIVLPFLQMVLVFLLQAMYLMKMPGLQLPLPGLFFDRMQYRSTIAQPVRFNKLHVSQVVR